MNNVEQKEFTKALLKWFRGHARILPWREDPAPYKVWISEIMLQQTRVAQVMPYFNRFIKRFPDVPALAKAKEDELLKAWEGLGYYSRVRNLNKAAIKIMADYDGKIPQDYDELLKLPGIGEYTAGAISSIAYNQARPAIDGNVLRVFSRVLAEDGYITDAVVKKRIEKNVSECLPKDYPGVYNQSLMELGALICLPNGEPKCSECPVNGVCKAYKLHRMTDFPVKPPKKARTIEEKTILILQDAQYIAIRKRPDKGLLAGMYEFPAMEGIHTEEQVLEYVKKMGFAPLHIKALCKAKHVFTHKEWHMLGYAIKVDELTQHSKADEDNALLFVEPEKTQQEYPIPAAYEAYADYYHIKLGNARFE